MSKTIGRQIEFGYADEASRGSAESSADFWQEWGEVNPNEQVEHAIREQAKGLLADSDDAELQKQFAEIDVTTPITPESAMHFLYALLGSISTTSPESGVEEHTITNLEDVKKPSYTLFVDDKGGGVDIAFPLSVLNELVISYNLGEFASMAANWICRKGDDTASVSPSHTDMNRFSQKHLTFKIGGSAVKIKSLELTISNNVEHDDVLGSVDPEDFLATQLSIEGSIELLYQDRTQVDNLLDDNKKKFEILMQNTDVTIGTTENPGVDITLPKCSFTEVGKELSLNDLNMQTVNFKAHYDDSTSEAINAVVTNTVASL